MPGIHIVGGGSQNDHLSQLTADVSGREVIAGPIEATAMGNAIVQAIALGEIANIEAGRDLIRKSDLKLHSFAPRQVLKLPELRKRYQEISRMELR
jgi:rhamnulokinase